VSIVQSVRMRAVLVSCVLSIFQQQPVLPQSAVDGDHKLPKATDGTVAASDWRQCVVGKPVYMLAKMPDGSQKSYMWYAARSENSDSSDVNLSLAIAEDGINYSPLAVEQSPYSVPGEVLAARQVVGSTEKYSAVKFGEPTIATTKNGLQATFYHVELMGERPVSAGIASAHSSDGVNWKLDKQNPMSISVTKASSEQALESRLSKISSACAQM
jgi:hypothetical protein